MIVRLVAAVAVIGCVAAILVALLGNSRESEQVQVRLRPLLVYETRPENVIKHGVDWSSSLDPKRTESLLTGPSLFSAEIKPEPGSKETILFSWFDMPESSESPEPRPVRVTTDQEKTATSLTVGPAAYFLSKTQQLSEGTPAENPASLSQFVAYPVTGGEFQPRSVEFETSEGPQSYQLDAARFLCVPAEEWHHDEHFGVVDASACWLVYDIPAADESRSISTLGQFGFNKLELSGSKWLCVPVTKIP